jgi:hypothetical protein
MSETTPNAAVPAASPAGAARPRRSAGRVALIVTGAVVAVLGFLTVATGGALLWGNSQKDADGYLSTATDRFHTKTYAIATDNLDVDTDGASDLVSHDLFGAVRVRVHSRDGKPVFVGIARTGDVGRYLGGSAHTTVTDVNSSPFRVSYRDAGGGRPAAPARQDIWDAEASGDGTQTLNWDVKDGNWSVVVMNADGSANVDAGVSAGAELPWMTAAGWTAIGLGVLLLALAGGLVAGGTRRPRPERAPAAVAPAAAI